METKLKHTTINGVGFALLGGSKKDFLKALKEGRVVFHGSKKERKAFMQKLKMRTNSMQKCDRCGSEHSLHYYKNSRTGKTFCSQCEDPADWKGPMKPVLMEILREQARRCEEEYGTEIDPKKVPPSLIYWIRDRLPISLRRRFKIKEQE